MKRKVKMGGKKGGHEQRMGEARNYSHIRNSLCPGQPPGGEDSPPGFKSPPIVQNFLKNKQTRHALTGLTDNIHQLPLELHGASCYRNKRALELNNL